MNAKLNTKFTLAIIKFELHKYLLMALQCVPMEWL